MPVLRVRDKAHPAIEAMEWNDDSKDEVLSWLSSNGIGYTFHEINSAGQLVIYTDGGPMQIPFGNFIIRTGSRMYNTCSKQSFDAFYEVIDDVETEDPTTDTQTG